MTSPDEPRTFQDHDPTAANAGKDTPPYANKPGQEMMGDGTEEQNLGQEGDPSARISEDEVEEAFKGQQPQEKR